MAHATTLRVRYAETDQMGIAHHSAAIVWFEQGRTECMAALGMGYGEMERRGWFMPIVEIGIRYRAPARFEDVVRVETSITEVRGARIRFAYRAHHDGDDRLLYEGFTVLGCTDRTGRPVRMPAEVRDLARFDGVQAPDRLPEDGMTTHPARLLVVVLCLVPLACSSGPEPRPEPAPASTTGEPTDGPGGPAEARNELENQAQNQLLLDLDRYTEEWQRAREQGRVAAYGGLERLLRKKVDGSIDRLAELAADRENPRGRLIASKALGFAGEGTTRKRARDALVGLLGAEDPRLVANALMGISLLADGSEPADRIALQLDSFDAMVQQNAALALYRVLREGGRLEGADLERTRTRLSVMLLDTERAGIRGNAAAALGALGDPEAESELLNLLRDPDIYPRLRAIVALAHVGTERCLDPLVQMLGAAEPNVRARAAQALAIVTGRLGYELDAGVLGEDPLAWRDAIRARRDG